MGGRTGGTGAPKGSGIEEDGEEESEAEDELGWGFEQLVPSRADERANGKWQMANGEWRKEWQWTRTWDVTWPWTWTGLGFGRNNRAEHRRISWTIEYSVETDQCWV